MASNEIVQEFCPQCNRHLVTACVHCPDLDCKWLICKRCCSVVDPFNADRYIPGNPNRVLNQD